ncbi:hypothetical protein ACP70R_015444 [Stipagrostis hirtigluma subsp. patula]
MAATGFAHQDSMAAAVSINHDGGMDGAGLHGAAATFDRDNPLDGKDVNQGDITGEGIDHTSPIAGEEVQHKDVDGAGADHNGALPRENNSTQSEPQKMFQELECALHLKMRLATSIIHMLKRWDSVYDGATRNKSLFGFWELGVGNGSGERYDTSRTIHFFVFLHLNHPFFIYSFPIPTPTHQIPISKHVQRADGSVSSRYLVCSNEGQKAIHPTHETKKEQAVSRTSCGARVQFSITPEGIWKIQKVILEHNHSFVSPDKTHMLRSQRQISKADQHIMKTMRTAGIKQSEIFSFFEQWSGGAEHVPFLQMDCNNYIRNERKKYLETNDAQTLLEYLKNKQAEDPSFFYAVQIDEENVSFDTTFQTNKFEMPFAPLLGFNHHKQTIVFGAALLYDESAESFVWLFRTFLQAMSGKQPETIFTDQCAAMAKAIAFVFPDTRHRLCLWHIYQKAPKHLGHVIANNREFLSQFKKCVYEDRSRAHFQKVWNDFLVKYKVKDNSWLDNMYKLREKWATVHRRDSFSADMTSTQRSEGMNNVFKKTFRRKLSLSELLEEYDRCIVRLRRAEKYEDYKSRHTDPVRCIDNLPLLETAAKSYTRTVYYVFEEEFKKQFSLSCSLLFSEGINSTYKVTAFDDMDDEAIVALNPSTLDISCSCKLYGCVGILCKHALKVFNSCNIVTLPSQYILNRWTKYAKQELLSGKAPSDKGRLEPQFAHISRKMISLALKCKPSDEVLAYLNNGIDKLSCEVDDLLSNLSLDEKGDPGSYLECTDEVAKTRISFGAPIRKKGPMSKRIKDVLEGGKKGKTKATSKTGKGKRCSTNAVHRESTSADVTEPIPIHGTLDSNVFANNITPSSSTALSFGDYPGPFLPNIHGEFTSLLLQAHHDPTALPTVRQLNFGGKQ